MAGVRSRLSSCLATALELDATARFPCITQKGQDCDSAQHPPRCWCETGNRPAAGTYTRSGDTTDHRGTVHRFTVRTYHHRQCGRVVLARPQGTQKLEQGMKIIYDILYAVIVLALLITLARMLTSCTLQVDPDGTRHWSVSGSEIARGIIIYSK